MPGQPMLGYPGAPAPERQMTAQEEEEERRIQERTEARQRLHEAQVGARGGAAMKIRENYVPRAAQRAANKQTGQALCPNCKQLIPVNELQEHMRSKPAPLFLILRVTEPMLTVLVELLDPRWKEQKAKGDARHAITDLSQVDVANNLKRFASQRSDVFDSVTGEPLSEEEQARRKKAAMFSFDGNPDGKSQAHMAHLQKMTVDEQLKALREKFAGGK
jgi:splicing factor 3A subunit 1